MTLELLILTSSSVSNELHQTLFLGCLCLHCIILPTAVTWGLTCSLVRYDTFSVQEMHTPKAKALLTSQAVNGTLCWLASCLTPALCLPFLLSCVTAFFSPKSCTNLPFQDSYIFANTIKQASMFKSPWKWKGWTKKETPSTAIADASFP